MTEVEWLATAWSPLPLLEHLRGRVTDRKLTLFGRACLRMIPAFGPADRARSAALLDDWERRTSRMPAWQAAVEASNLAYMEFSRRARPAVDQVPLLRDIVGNPFRQVTCEPTWRTRDVLGLASAIFDEAAFERLPILADALLDAGCADETILAHCRGPGPHVRGCWVVDLLLEHESPAGAESEPATRV